MEKEKQIEEMAKDIWDSLPDYEHNFRDCRNAAERMLTIGYHKERQGEWKLHKDGSGTCNNCGTTQRNVWDMDNFQAYCGHCGAKMKGAE